MAARMRSISLRKAGDKERHKLRSKRGLRLSSKSRQMAAVRHRIKVRITLMTIFLSRRRRYRMIAPTVTK